MSVPSKPNIDSMFDAFFGKDLPKDAQKPPCRLLLHAKPLVHRRNRWLIRSDQNQRRTLVQCTPSQLRFDAWR